MRLLKKIADTVPLNSRIKVMAGGLVFGGIFNPSEYSVTGKMIQELERASWYTDVVILNHGVEYGLYFIMGLGVPLFLSKFLYPGGVAASSSKGSIFKRKISKPERIISIKNGDKGMTFSENDLYTNLMITGAIGSGKTSSAIYPMLEQLLNIYNVDDSITDEEDPYQKLGGLVLDVKGDFYEALIWLMHLAGRNVLTDLVVITPFSEYAFVELEDVENGRKFYVSCRGGGDATSIEMNRLLLQHRMLDPHTLKVNPKRKIPVDMLTDKRRMQQRIHPSYDLTYDGYIKSLEFDVSDGTTKFIGWRTSSDGKTLERALRTDSDRNVVWAKDRNGKVITTDMPNKVKFKRIRYVNNGLTFNICPPSLDPAELSSRMVSMSKSAGGSSGGGENSFWEDATKKHLGWSVMLLREVNPEREVTAIDLNQMTVNEERIEEEVAELQKVIERKEMELDSLTGNEKDTLREELIILNDMLNYFESEWGDLDQRTKSNLQSTITNLFGAFMSDPKLRRTFCVSSSFRLEEIIQSGKIFTLVAPNYESAARVFGTALKLEFQAILRRRPATSHFNKKRFILFMCDEAQNYVTAGGADNTGDENFMALSRQSKVCNVIATQSDSSIINVIGEKSAPVYYQGFGSRIWYQNLDRKTNEAASNILGKKKVEKRSASGDDFSIGGMLSKDSKSMNYNVSEDTKERFPPESFSTLNVHEAVMYNKGKKGKKEKSSKVQLVPHFIGDPKLAHEKAAVIRWYFQAYIENRLFDLNEYTLQDISDEEYLLEEKNNDDPEAEANKYLNVDTEDKPKKKNLQKTKSNDKNVEHEEEHEEEEEEGLGLNNGESVLGARRVQVERREQVEGLDDEDSETVSRDIKDEMPEHVKEVFDLFEEEEGDEDITDVDIEEIRNKFGAEGTVGDKLSNFVSIVDATAKIKTNQFEVMQYAETYADINGDRLTGDEGFFSASEELLKKQQEKEDKKEEQQEKEQLDSNFDEEVPWGSEKLSGPFTEEEQDEQEDEENTDVNEDFSFEDEEEESDEGNEGNFDDVENSANVEIDEDLEGIGDFEFEEYTDENVEKTTHKKAPTKKKVDADNKGDSALNEDFLLGDEDYLEDELASSDDLSQFFIDVK